MPRLCPCAGLNPARQRRYCEDRLSRLTDRLVGVVDTECELDALFAEIDSSVAASRAMMGEEAVDWRAVEAFARGRGFSDCPICLAPFEGSEKLSLLSCSHVFHERCVLSFERFSISSVCSCPVCRACYTKTTIVADPSTAKADSPVAAVGSKEWRCDSCESAEPQAVANMNGSKSNPASRKAGTVTRTAKPARETSRGAVVRPPPAAAPPVRGARSVGMVLGTR